MSCEIDKIRERYWEDLYEDPKDPNYDPSVKFKHRFIELNVLAEIIIENIVRTKHCNDIAHIKLGNFFIDDIFLKDTPHTEINLKETGLYCEIPNKGTFGLIFCSFPFLLGN